MPDLPNAPKTDAELAIFWGLREARTIRLWRSKGAPTSDTAATASWVLKQQNMAPAALKVARSIVGASKTVAEPSGEPAETDWEKFRREATVANPQEAMNQVALARDFASMKFQAAAAKDDEAGMKFYGDLLAKMAGVLHDAELRAKKLGLDQGELVPKPLIESMLRALMFWTMKGIDADLSELCPRLVGIAQVNDVRSVLEPALLSNRIVRPYAKASRITSPSALPEWAVATMKDAADDYIEGGEEEFQEAAK